MVCCCDELKDMVDREMVRVGQIHTLRDGRILNEIDTEYFLSSVRRGQAYVGMNYCPFCGGPVSRGLWNLEKKKQEGSEYPGNMRPVAVVGIGKTPFGAFPDRDLVPLTTEAIQKSSEGLALHAGAG